MPKKHENQDRGRTD